MPREQVDHPGWYEIGVRGRLDERWSSWFEGMELVTTPDGDTCLRGPVVDQAALHGLLNRLRDLGLPLLHVRRVDAPPDAPPVTPPVTPHPERAP